LTLMAWNENFEKGWAEIRHLYDTRFYRTWRYYLHFCAAAFRAGNNRCRAVYSGKLSGRLQVSALRPSLLSIRPNLIRSPIAIV
jgi:hypothetical protein